jgi:hypothetical protein
LFIEFKCWIKRNLFVLHAYNVFLILCKSLLTYTSSGRMVRWEFNSTEGINILRSWPMRGYICYFIKQSLFVETRRVHLSFRQYRLVSFVTVLSYSFFSISMALSQAVMEWLYRMTTNDRIMLLINLLTPIIWRLAFYIPYGVVIFMTIICMLMMSVLIISCKFYWDWRTFDRVRKHIT